MNFNLSPYIRFAAKSTTFLKETVVARDCRLLYVISGCGRFESGGEVMKLTPNTLIYYPYGFSYRIVSEPGNELLFYTINFDFTQAYTDITTMVPESVRKHRPETELHSILPDWVPTFFRVIRFENAMWAENNIQTICSEAMLKNAGYAEIQSAHMKILLIHMYRNRTSVVSEHPICKSIKDLISENLSLNVQELAGRLSYHPYYLNAVFKKNEGISLYKYILQRRQIKAYELIMTTSLSLEEIAFLCGFSSLSHFSTAFKAAYRIPPSQLRRQA